MSLKAKTYHRLGTESPDEGEKQPMIDEIPVRFAGRSRQSRLLQTILALSVLLNIGLALLSGRSIAKERALSVSCEYSQPPVSQSLTEHAVPMKPELVKSEFAGLVYDQPIEWIRGHPLGSTDMAVMNKTWQETIDIDPGVIVLHKTYAADHSLPRSSQFAWDDDKEIYYLNGFHDLHCVKSLHMAISEFVLEAPQTYELKHITHCLNALRETVMCHAEDTPRIALIKPYPENAPTQSRMCRSWDQLTAWARPLTACYKYINEEAKHLNSLERYKFCAPGSPYLEKVREYWREHFGREVGW